MCVWLTYSTVNSPPYRSISSVANSTLRMTLTARTRKREVFPAFCKPIMVTSISVDLPKKSAISRRPKAERARHRTATAMWSWQKRRYPSSSKQQEHIPEHSEQPIIDTFEKSSHTDTTVVDVAAAAWKNWQGWKTTTVSLMGKARS